MKHIEEDILFAIWKISKIDVASDDRVIDILDIYPGKYSNVFEYRLNLQEIFYKQNKILAAIDDMRDEYIIDFEVKTPSEERAKQSAEIREKILVRLTEEDVKYAKVFLRHYINDFMKSQFKKYYNGQAQISEMNSLLQKRYEKFSKKVINLQLQGRKYIENNSELSMRRLYNIMCK